MVKVLARELGPHGIRVNAVAPGMVETEATAHWTSQRKQMVAHLAPLRRIATPEDVAGAIFLLASNEAQYITGTYLTVNGGIFMP
jgi:3-oxoacyl-[acyl-carrier protein] reductase